MLTLSLSVYIASQTYTILRFKKFDEIKTDFVSNKKLSCLYRLNKERNGLCIQA